MNLYQKQIALFGLAVPALLAVVAIAALMTVKSRLGASFAEKVSHYDGYARNKLEALSLEAEITRQREHVQRWDAMLGEETPSVITSYISQIEDTLPSKEFMMTTKDHPGGKAGFANVSAQTSGQVRLSFRATFRSMQRALVELESRMPQLQLQEMRIDPSPNSNSLNVSLGYTAWEQ